MPEIEILSRDPSEEARQEINDLVQKGYTAGRNSPRGITWKVKEKEGAYVGTL